MVKKIQRFNKIINDIPKAMELYEEQKITTNRIKELDTLIWEAFSTYREMEGKYSVSTETDYYSGQGYRNWHYVYPNKEVKAQEEKERQIYYTENITPLDIERDELLKRKDMLDEMLCFAVWGFGIKQYEAYRRIENVKKELIEQKARVEKLEKELAKLEKEIEEF